jgi:hypothetical protein
VRHALRSRRFYERVAVAVIALASLRGIGQENRASMMARLSAWSKRQTQRLEREAEHQARAVKGAGQMARSGPPRGPAGTMPTRTKDASMTAEQPAEQAGKAEPVTARLVRAVTGRLKNKYAGPSEAPQNK